MLNTGRLLEHWHTGSMTRRSFALDTIAPRAEVYLHADDAAGSGCPRRRDGPGALAARADHAEREGVGSERRRATASSRSTSARRPPTCSRPTRSTRWARSPSTSSARSRSSRSPRPGYDRRRPTPGGPVPASRRAAGKFPGPEPDPGPERDPGAVGWLPREELVSLSRDTRRPLYEIQGLVSFYPHYRTEPPRAGGAARVPRPVLLAARRLTTGSPRCASSTATTPTSSWSRCPAWGAATTPRPWRSTTSRAHVDDADELVARARSAYRRGGAGRPPPARRGAVAERPVRARRASATGCCAACWPVTSAADADRASPAGLRAAWHGWRRLPDRQEVGAGRRRRRRRPKYAICNADESEPGTFKDRQILGDQPHLVLEGLLLGMVVVGAEEGFVFVRHEYGPEADVVRDEIDRLRPTGLLGDDVLGSRPAAAGGACSSRPAATSSARSPR